MKVQNILNNTYLKGILLVFVGLFLGWLLFHNSVPTTTSSTSTTDEHKEIWTCSMHPQIRMEHSGLCPICAMELIPVEQNESKIDENAVVMSADAMKLASIQTFIASKKPSIKEIRLNGKIQADERTEQSLRAHVSGRIEKLYVNFTGERISSGQRIATIYSPELINAQQELFEAIKIKDIQPKLLEAAREKLSQLKLTPKQIEEIEKSTKIKTLFDVYANASGVIISKKVSNGDYVQTGSPLFDIADLNQVWVMFDAYESDLPWLRIGSKISYTLQAMPGKEYKGTISFIDPVIDPMTRVAKARIEVANSSGEFKPEMLVTGIAQSQLGGSGNRIIIPESAVLWTGKRSIVYIKLPNTDAPTFLYREVTLGNYLQNSYEIAEGLSEGEEVVINGAFSIDASAQLSGKKSMMNVETKDQNKSETKNEPHINTDSKTQQEQSRFMVEGNCEMCEERIEKAAKKVPGVISADWNVDTKMMDVRYDKSKTSVDEIQKTIANAGHDATNHKANPTVYEKLPECCKYRDQ